MGGCVCGGGGLGAVLGSMSNLQSLRSFDTRVTPNRNLQLHLSPISEDETIRTVGA